ILDPERIEDDRGFFARVWCEREFHTHGLDTGVAQCSISFNNKMGTLRGMHFQMAPHEETKLVRCTMGAIYDAIVDLRKTSPTYGDWLAVELSASNRRQIYVPQGCAHGFQTLLDDTEVSYQISENYAADDSRGVRWDDPRFGIEWPAHPQIMSDRDRSYPDFVS
ncbi:MAG: dTDP-4-dehydrorhamnose 3,5-epimerase, partial [Dehalococcoidia bacterium]